MMSTGEKAAVEKSKTKSKFKRLTNSQIAEATALWKSGAATLKDLAQRFDKSEETFSRLFARLGVKKGEAAEEHSKSVAEKVEASIVDDAGELAKRIRETKEEHFKMASGIRKLIWNEIVEARKNKVAISTTLGNLKALEKAAQALKITREEAYVLLGIADGEDDSDEVPDLQVKELTADEIKAIHQQQQAEIAAAENDDDLPAVELDGELK